MWPTMWLLKYWVCLTLQDNAKHACVQNLLDLSYPLFALFSLIDKYVTFGSTIMLFTWHIHDVHMLNYTAAAKNVFFLPTYPTPLSWFFFSGGEEFQRQKVLNYGINIMPMCNIHWFLLFIIEKYTEGISVIWKFHLLLFKIKV